MTTSTDTQPCEDIRVNGRRLRPRITEVTIIDERGRFLYLGASYSTTGTLSLNFLGGKPGHEKFRSFRQHRIKIVHRISRHTRRS